MSPIALFKRFTPLIEYLNNKVKRDFIIETSHNFSQHVKKTASRRFDFLLTAPHFVLAAVNTGHYRVIATYNKPLTAIIVVHKNSAIRSLSDLHGKTISTPAPEAIISIVGKKLLSNDSRLNIRYLSFRNHNAAYQAMLSGESQAAVISIYVYLDAIKKGLPLRELAKSKQFPAVGILAATDLPDSVVKRFVYALVNMSTDKKGREALKLMAFPGYRKASPLDYAILPNAVSLKIRKTKSSYGKQ